MDIEQITEWALGFADEQEIATLLQRCFGTDFGGRSFYQTRQSLRLVQRRGRIVGHMAMQFRAVRLGGRLITVAGLADVATDPEFRGQGIAGQLLAVAMEVAEASQAEYFLLFGTAKLYQAAGFRAVHNPMIWIDMQGAITSQIRREPAESLMVRRLRGTAWDAAAELDMLGNLF